MTLPNPAGLSFLDAVGWIAKGRDEACREPESISGALCARQAGHEPFPHAGMWQDPEDPDSWVVTMWPVVD